MDRINLIKQFIKSGSDEDYEKLIDDENIIFFVDHREQDDEIVSMCESILKTGNLSAQYVDADNYMGYDIIINYKGSNFRIPYLGEGSDRDTTLITLNEVLQPDYSLRLCKKSVGDDTLSFLPLFNLEWKKLENEYSKVLSEQFIELRKGKKIF